MMLHNWKAFVWPLLQDEEFKHSPKQLHLKVRKASKAYSGKRHGRVFAKPINNCVACSGGSREGGLAEMCMGQGLMEGMLCVPFTDLL